MAWYSACGLMHLAPSFKNNSPHCSMSGIFFLNELHNHVKNDMHLLHFKIYERYQYGFFISFYYLYVSLKSLHVLNVNYFEI